MSPPDHESFRVAQTYWGLPVGERTLRKLAQVLGVAPITKAALNRLGRIVNRWEERGRVRHTVSPEVRNPKTLLPRDHALEDRLRYTFGLRGAVVVDVADLEPACEPSQDPLEWDRYDDQIHRRLGAWARRILMGSLRPVDVLGTGSGRGPYYTAKDWVIPPWGPKYPRQVVSLTGQMTTRLWAEGGEDAAPHSLDADAIANLLSYSLRTPCPPRCLDRSILQQPGDESPRADDVTTALIGIGALAGRHRLVKYGDGEDLRPIAPQLERFNQLVSRLDPKAQGRGPFHHWVGDVCNHLFVVNRSIEGEVLPNEQRRRLEEEVRSLNRIFLNTSPQALNGICDRGSVLAVASGPHKVAAVAHVLWEGRASPWITHLITDRLVALSALQMTPPATPPS
jgi:DNA-binding transcriptional regulator LsrR (DeoR family)